MERAFEKIGAIRWKGNLKTNDRGTGGQITPGADAARSETAKERLVGRGWGTLIDRVWQLLISYQPYL